MDYSNLKSIIQAVKENNSCFAFLRNALGINIPHEGAAICCPNFIRPDDHHPSFTAYHHIAIDFSTSQSYDVIDLARLALFNGSFPQALEYLYGSKIYWGKNSSPNQQDVSSYFSREGDYQDFARKISDWHNTLLNTPHVIDYCHSRKISDTFINDYMLGYSPEMKRLIFPYKKNSHFVYWNGRDMSGNSSLPSSDPNYVSKYRKCALSYSPICENVAFGLQSLRPHSKSKHTYTASDGQVYDTGEVDPRDTTLCLIEGMVDAASLIQEGWQVLSPGGGHFNSSYFKTVLDICKVYERVALCFDNDEAGKKFQMAMSRKLFDAKITFVCAHVPTTFTAPDGRIINGIKDVNDYYCAGGDLAELIKNATPGIVELARNAQNEEELAEIFRKASRYCTSVELYRLKEECKKIEDEEVNEATGFHYAKYSPKLINFLFNQAMKPIPEPDVAQMVAEDHTIRYDVSGTFYEYSCGIWQSISEYIVQKYVGLAMRGKASSGRMASIAKYIRAMNADRLEFNKNHVIVFPNGTLHLNEPDKTQAFHQHSENDMCTIVMSYPYNPDARAPKWEKFIREICNGNKNKMRLMQQIAGYIMCPDCRLQKIFYFLGDGRNGKSVYSNILTQVYGSENCSSVPPSRLGTQFDPIALKDSLMNICYEAKSVLNGSEETLKAVASGDPIMAAHKGVDAVTFKTRAKMIVLANKLMTSDDNSYGFLRRILFVKFDKQFTGDADNKNLYAELLEELPGIFNWCYEGYRDLMDSGDFEVIDDQMKVCEELAEMMSPVSVFVNEILLNADRRQQYAGRIVEDKEIYRLYKEWCTDGGFKIENRLEFLKDMALILRQRKAGIRIASDDYAKCKVFIFDRISEAEGMGTEEQEDRPSGKDAGVIALGGRGEEGPSEVEKDEAEGPSSANDDEEVIPEGTRENADSNVDDRPSIRVVTREGQAADRAKNGINGIVGVNEARGETQLTREETPPVSYPPQGNTSFIHICGERAGTRAGTCEGTVTPSEKIVSKVVPALSAPELDKRYRAAIKSRDTELDTQELHAFTYPEWECLKAYYVNGDKVYPSSFRNDYYFYGRNAYRADARVQKSSEYGVNDYEAAKSVPTLMMTAEQCYMLVRQYVLGKFMPKSLEEWDEFALFFRDYPEIEPRDFRVKYQRAQSQAKK